MSVNKSNKNEETIVDVKEVYSKTERYVEENRRPLGLILGIMTALFVGYFAYTRLYLEPRGNEANELMWKAEYYFEVDSLDKAIYGDDLHFGFEYIAETYGRTRPGKLAHYYLGVIYLRKAEYDLAIEHLKKADLKDEIVGAMAKGTLGDIYVDLGDYPKALNQFNAAISHSKNDFTAPLYLKKAALVHEANGDIQKALDNYRKIKEDYPTSNEGKNIDFYIARVGG